MTEPYVRATAPRPELGALPSRIASLPLDHRGYPVPWFVAEIDGRPDFRVIGPGKMVAAHNFSRCWICGQRMGAYLAFVIGPMCLINRVSSEPPSHKECAVFAAVHCPFLARPAAVRRDANLPDERKPPAGVRLTRNPGVALVLVTKSYRVFDPRRIDPNAVPGVLFGVGDPVETLWFREGRSATRDEVEESVRTGLPLLVGTMPAGADVTELNKAIAAARKFYPPAEVTAA